MPTLRAALLTERVIASSARKRACRSGVHPSRRDRWTTGRNGGTRGWCALRGRVRGYVFIPEVKAEIARVGKRGDQPGLFGRRVPSIGGVPKAMPGTEAPGEPAVTAR